VSDRYHDGFFDRLEEVALGSAREIVPALIELVQPGSVVDLGCARGAWLRVFQENGVEDVFGVDGTYVDTEKLMIPKDHFQPADLGAGIRLPRQFDLAMSVEVAEHLPEASADGFVDSLVGLAPVVAFSAAVPGQGGREHVNEQWQSWWAGKFEQRGYLTVDALRRRLWSRDGVQPYYAQNLLLYVREDALSRYDALRRELERTEPGQLDLIHPSLYLRRTQLSTRKLVRLLRRDLLGRFRGGAGSGAPRP
jgi:SAM-dependent methyltransferase